MFKESKTSKSGTCTANSVHFTQFHLINTWKNKLKSCSANLQSRILPLNMEILSWEPINPPRTMLDIFLGSERSKLILRRTLVLLLCCTRAPVSSLNQGQKVQKHKLNAKCRGQPQRKDFSCGLPIYLLSWTRSFQTRPCPFVGTVVCSVGPFICYPSDKIVQAHGLVYKHQLPRC